VNGKALRVRETLVLENPSGDELAKIQERKLRVRDTMKGRAEPQHGCDRDEGDRQPSAGPVFGRS
jgi:uncharacterized protein YxjI